MAKSKRKRSEPKYTGVPFAAEKEAITKLDTLIEKLTALEANSTGSRQLTWRIKLVEAKAARAKAFGSMRDDVPTVARARYHTHGRILQGGAPGLKR